MEYNPENLQEKNIAFDVLSKLERAHNFKDGFKLLYCPWERLSDANIAFVSLNPGRAPDNYENRSVEDLRGNSYLAERASTKSPLTEQFLKMCEFIGAPPNEILTGAFFPFRSAKWKNLDQNQIETGVIFARSFWAHAISKNCKLIITTGHFTAENLVNLFECKLEIEIDSKWGTSKLRRYLNKSGKTIIQLPHLSSFKLFSREECNGPLKKIFENSGK